MDRVKVTFEVIKRGSVVVDVPHNASWNDIKEAAEKEWREYNVDGEDFNMLDYRETFYRKEINMKKVYIVDVKEVLERKVVVEASNNKEAQKQAIQMYKNSEVVLDDFDSQGVTFEVENCLFQ